MPLIVTSIFNIGENSTIKEDVFENYKRCYSCDSLNVDSYCSEHHTLKTHFPQADDVDGTLVIHHDDFIVGEYPPGAWTSWRIVH